MAFAYPIALELKDRECVVFGGGEVAEQKARGLIEAGARVTVIAPKFIPALETAADTGVLQLRARAYEPGDLQGVFLAIAATNDPKINRRIFAEANERGVLLNAVDDVGSCHFAVPSVVRRGDFIVAISTGGKAPALAKRLRRELSAQFGYEYGTLVDILGASRAESLPRRKVDFDTWATRWQSALDQELLELVKRGQIEEAQALVTRILDGDDVPPRQRARSRSLSPGALRSARRGHVAIVGAGPGDPSLITVRGKELLDAADVVVYDRLVHPSLVSGKRAIFVGKRRGGQLASQEQINAVLIDLARGGHAVVRLKGGDPFVFGRGSEEAEALAEAGISFEVVPAPSSAIAALAYAGIPVTDRRYSSSVIFIAGRSGTGAPDWDRVATAADTLVVLMGLESIEEIAAALIGAGRDPRTPAAVIENGTLPGQRVVVADIEEIAEVCRKAEFTSPAIIVIGDVVRLRSRIAWFADSPEEGEEPAPRLAG